MNPQQAVNSIAPDSPAERESFGKKSFTILGRFREIGKEIDPNKDWEKYSSTGFYSKDSNFEIISGSNNADYIAGVREFTGNQRKASFEYQFKDIECVSKINGVLRRALPVFNSTNTVQLFLDIHDENTEDKDNSNTEIKPELNIGIARFIKDNPNFTPEHLEIFLIDKVLDKIPDKESATSSVEVEAILSEYLDKRDQDTSESKENVKSILKKMATKLDKEAFSILMENINESFKFNIFDKDFNYSLLLSEEWLAAFIRSRGQGFVTSIETPAYPTINQINRQINNPEELKTILLQEKFEAAPSGALIKEGAFYQEELVDIATVVGMSGTDTWIIQEVKGSDKGLNSIWKWAEFFKKNDLHYKSENRFIKGIRVGGKIYVHEDGRNRFAALKALGVKQIPMLIIEGEISERTSVSSII
jgi:hypothetical protein